MIPAEASAAWYPRAALLGREPAGRAGDRADPPMPELEQVLIAWLAPELFAAETAGMRSFSGMSGSTTTKRIAVVEQVLELLVRLLREDEQRAVGRAVHQPLEQGDLAIVLVLRRAEHDPHVLLVERLGRAREDRREVAGCTFGIVTPTKPVRPPERPRALRLTE